MFTTLTVPLAISLCQPEPDNRYSRNQNAIIVISELKESEQEKAKNNIIGHVPDVLAQVICPFLKAGTVQI